MTLDLPPHLHERIVCSIQAAVKYDVPANIVLAVAETEGGKPGQWVRNANGTHDVGYMQFNTAYLGAQLARYGITAQDVAGAGCYAFELASWRLRGHLRDDSGDIWTRAANYHSRTPRYNTIYRAKLIHKAAKWEKWLQARFVTVDLSRDKQLSATARTPAAGGTSATAALHGSRYVPRAIAAAGP